MKRRRIFTVPILLSVLFVWNGISLGFGNKVTHPAITSKSINASTADDYLKNNLGLSGGVQTELQYDVDLYNEVIRERIYRGDFQPLITQRSQRFFRQELIHHKRVLCYLLCYLFLPPSFTLCASSEEKEQFVMLSSLYCKKNTTELHC
jgi:hypothetical protein